MRRPRFKNDVSALYNEDSMPKCLKSYADLDKANEYRNRQRRNNYARGALNTINGWKLWEKDEDELILDKFFADRELSEILGRSVQAMQIRRCRIKKHAGN